MKKARQKLFVATLAAIAVPVMGMPAFAGPVAVRGIVTKIDGELVTLRQPWGDLVTVKVDTRKQNRPGMNALVVGSDAAITLDPKSNNPSVAIKVCTCVSEAPAFVAVQPIPVPQIGGPVTFPPRPPAPPVAPPSPPPRILFF